MGADVFAKQLLVLRSSAVFIAYMTVVSFEVGPGTFSHKGGHKEKDNYRAMTWNPTSRAKALIVILKWN